MTLQTSASQFHYVSHQGAGGAPSRVTAHLRAPTADTAPPSHGGRPRGNPVHRTEQANVSSIQANECC